MAKNKLSIAKVMLVLIIMLCFGVVAGVTAYGLNLKKNPIAAANCPPTVTDIDGNTYNTVQIGSQCWMKENLRVTKNPEGKAITRYCYNNDNGICSTDGGLYTWDTAMNNSTTDGAQGICPDSWHVPKDSEWYTLESGLKDDGQDCRSDRNNSTGSAWSCNGAGTKLKQEGSSSFEALLTGFRSNFVETFDKGRGENTTFWSSTSDTKIKSFSRGLKNTEAGVDRISVPKMNNFSVRCLKD